MDSKNNKLLLKDEEQCLYKHVATIHKSNTLTLLQNKISNILYFNAFHDLKTKEVHSITVKELCNYLNYKGHNYEEIKGALKGLISTVIEWNLLKDEKINEENWTASTVLASVSIKKGGICEYSYSYHMRELLADPAVYGVINMIYQANFRSKYGLALYENCVRFVNVKQTGWFNIEFFRELLGVERNKYLEFRDFKRRVLDVAINEINMYSDIYVEPILQKNGRKVANIKFKIEKREKKPKINLNSDAEMNSINTARIENQIGDARKLELISELQRRFLLSEKQALNSINTYGIDYVEQKMAIVGHQQKNIRSISAYFISALKNDYQNNKSIEQIKNEEIETLLDEYQTMKLEMFIEKINSEKGIDIKIADFFKRFEQHLLVNYPVLHGHYLKEKLNNKKVALLCYKFYSEKYYGLLGDEIG